MGDKNRPEKDDTGYTYTPDGTKIDKNDENGKRKITLAGETVNVSQNGSIVATDVDGNIVDTDVKEVRCLSTSTKPNVADFPLFTYLIEVDTDKIYYNDGTGWVLD